MLSRAISSEMPEVIAIAVVEALAHSPWELWADSQGFLVGRWVSGGRNCIEAVSDPKLDGLKQRLMATDPHKGCVIGV